MKIFFQTIGVLTQYNWALPYYMARKNRNLKMVLYTDIFSYIMGGFYYHLKKPEKIMPIIVESGISNKFDKYLEKIQPCPNYDLIHVNKAFNILTKKILKIKIPKVFTFHGSLDPIHIKNPSTICKELRIINNNVNFFVAVSKHSAKTIEELCDFTPIVVHNGIDTALFNPFNASKQEARKKLALPSEKKVILWSARLDPDKGLHTLVRALSVVVKSYDNILVIIKGRNTNKTYLKYINHLIEKLRLKKYFEFRLEWTPNPNMLYYYRASDIYVHTSVSEGFSLTLLEALASGIPVVGNNASSIPEAIGDAGLLFSNEEELSDMILEILFDKRLSNTLGRRGYRRIVEGGFKVDDVAEKYIRLYDTLL